MYLPSTWEAETCISFELVSLKPTLGNIVKLCLKKEKEEKRKKRKMLCTFISPQKHQEGGHSAMGKVWQAARTLVLNCSRDTS